MKKSELYYTGTIIEVLDPVLYEIKVDIPGVIQNVKAFPMRGEIDEPKVGDFVFLKCLDPLFQSYYLYQKIKENDFIGFRSNGKMVDITPDYIQIGIFDPSLEYTDTGDKNYRPEPTDWIRLTKDGVLDINLRSDSKININGNSSNVFIGSSDSKYNEDLSITVQGDTNIKVMGKTTLQSTSIDIKGPGTLTCKGVVTPSAAGGPFIAVPTAPPPGTPMISGDTIILS